MDTAAANPVALRATIDVIESQRNRALAMLDEAWDMLNAAADKAAEAMRIAQNTAPSVDGYSWRMEYPGLFGLKDDKAGFITGARKMVDRNIWTHLMDFMGLEPMMDRQARKEFQTELAENPPEVTAETCFATISGLIQDSDLIFKRGLANAFSGLDRRFRSHDGFKIGARICLSYAIREFGGMNDNTEATIRDVERVFLVLDGKQQGLRSGGIAAALRDATGWKRLQCTVENEYFKIRSFKNGNVHLWFLRDDLLRRVNELLADYYGETIGAGPDAPHAKQHEPNRTPAKNYGEFFSPPAVVDTVIKAATIKPGQTVLEPSAGNGALAIAARAAGGNVRAVEIQARHVATLREAGIAVQCADFLEVESLPTFDVVVMNPPFDRGRDVDHVSHALKFLKPGGILVAVMSASTEFRDDTKTTDFREKVRAMGGGFWDLPAGSFASVGTNVNTIVCVIGRGQWFSLRDCY